MPELTDTTLPKVYTLSLTELECKFINATVTLGMAMLVGANPVLALHFLNRFSDALSEQEKKELVTKLSYLPLT